jgi:hypothetical protein
VFISFNATNIISITEYVTAIECLLKVAGKIADINTELVLVRRRHGSSVGDVTMLRGGWRRESGSILGRSKRFLCYPDLLWDPPSSY